MLIQNKTPRKFVHPDLVLLPNGTKEVDDKVGEKLVNLYPGEIVDLDKIAKASGGADVKEIKAASKALKAVNKKLTASLEAAEAKIVELTDNNANTAEIVAALQNELEGFKNKAGKASV
jgi:hypothetical protein